MMRRLFFYGAALLAAGVALVVWRHAQPLPETLVENPTKPPEAAPLCPWRDPETSLNSFFPSATRYVLETRILSGMRLELARRLGRMPTGDENALRLYRIYQDSTVLGTVLTRRVKGDYGAIEIVLGVDENQRICGLRLQRLREPEPIARALQDVKWQRSFEGKGAGDSWQIGQDLPAVPAEAHSSAASVVEGVRSLLILLAGSEQAGSSVLVQAQHH